MGIDNKYYTPSIEEFYVGFQFEYLDKNKWIETNNFVDSLTEWDTESTYTVKSMIQDGEIRVKYLDKEDIESCGWVLINEIKSPFTNKVLDRYMINKEHGFNTGITWYLNQLDNNWSIESNSYSSYGSNKQNMEFNIKNKSELQKLMKQLGI